MSGLIERREPRAQWAGRRPRPTNGWKRLAETGFFVVTRLPSGGPIRVPLGRASGQRGL
jgi:hypothetical protein